MKVIGDYQMKEAQLNWKRVALSLSEAVLVDSRYIYLTRELTQTFERLDMTISSRITRKDTLFY